MDLASYITGFVDGEGCFCVSFNYRAKFATKVEVRPSFSISQNRLSLSALQKVQKFFGCGSIRFSGRDRTYKFEVRSINDLIQFIIPHFIRFPLITAKKNDFDKFVKICEYIHKNWHLNRDYLLQIIEWAYQMNLSGKKKYPKEFLLKLLAR